jgi:hypothetical protein
MREEDKNLLMIDLCSRLPYGVKVEAETWLEDEGEFAYVPDKVYSINSDGYIVHGYDEVYECKPYLFPLSSMTEEQKEEYRKVGELDTEILSKHPMDGTPFPALYNSQDWLNAHHFDYRGLIEKGLAIDATGKNIY